MKTKMVSIAAIAVFLSSLIGLAERQSAFTTIDVPGSTFTEVFGINNRGDMVGRYGSLAGSQFHGFLLRQGRFREIAINIDLPGICCRRSCCTQAFGINDRGDIVGRYGAVGFDSRGFVLDPKGNVTTIDAGGFIHTYALGINNRGDVVGGYGGDVFGMGLPLRFLPGEGGFVQRRRALTAIGVPNAAAHTLGINDHGDIVGHYYDTRLHGFVVQEDHITTVDVPGASATEAAGINNRGDIVGSYVVGGEATYGFVVRPSSRSRWSFTPIRVPGASTTQAFGINDRGDIVGAYVASGVLPGFVLRSAEPPDDEQF